MGLAGLLGLIGLICHIIILIDAFKSSVLKGLFGLLCGLYLLYYAIVEFKNENKWLIVILWLACGGAGGAFYRLAT